MTSSLQSIERARPLLGTSVAIRVQGLNETEAHHAIDDAFAEIALVHRLMSFHETESDVSRLQSRSVRSIHRGSPATSRSGLAYEMSQSSEGAFDITVAPELGPIGILPAPTKLLLRPARKLRDIELGQTIAFAFAGGLRRFGGIARAMPWTVR